MAFDHKAFLASLTTLPGVYQMKNRSDRVIYVGKAKNLKARLRSYFRQEGSSTPRRAQLVAEIHSIQVTITSHENEALILENNLIKQHQPKYNILLKDGKGYPYLRFSDDPFPQLMIHRGHTKVSGRCFGPYPNKSSVHDTLTLIQKVFKIRNCSNSFFSHRSRPCLQHQIGRCSAPCVHRIDEASYAKDVQDAMAFLDGESEALTEGMIKKMQLASAKKRYEQAATIRDQLSAIRSVQMKQHVDVDDRDVDVIAGMHHEGIMVVELLMIRAGRMIGHRSFPIARTASHTIEEVLGAFLPQYYLGSPLAHSRPRMIYTSHRIADAKWLVNTFREHWGHGLKLLWGRQGHAKHWVDLALTNAAHAIQRKQQKQIDWAARFASLTEWMGWERVPAEVVCFDISHHQGEATTASCVVCTPSGLHKSAYRLFHIKDVKGGDDYAAMEQALKRYIESSTHLPDCWLFDGGKGQLSSAHRVLKHFECDHIPHLGIAKGVGRKAGAEQFFLPNKNAPLPYPVGHLGVQLLCHLRDEAHRFAIKNHRQRKQKRMSRSSLEGVSGLGPQKRNTLLRHFGGLDPIARASVEQLMTAPGIGPALARAIYEHFHGH